MSRRGKPLQPAIAVEHLFGWDTPAEELAAKIEAHGIKSFNQAKSEAERLRRFAKEAN